MDPGLGSERERERNKRKGRQKDRETLPVPNPTSPALCQVWKNPTTDNRRYSVVTCSLTPFLYIFLLFNSVLDNDSEPVNEMIGKPQEWIDGEVLEPTWLTV